MSLHSMTGFARIDGRDAETGAEWVWDLRSVNGKGLDARFRLPAGFEPLEKPLRDALAAALSRGSVSIALTVARPAAAAGLALNTAWLETLIAASAEVRARFPGQVEPPAFDGLLQVKGVVETAETPSDETAEAALHAQLLADFSRAVAALAAARAEEGARIAAVVSEHVDVIADLVARAENTASARADTRKERLSRAVAELLDAADLPE
ncbi:MAG: YicC/YloC family endoribonuclease, partial [Rhodospirillaceae bacterium]